MKKLNGWQRIGVILSILWILGAAMHERNGQIELATMMAQSDREACSKSLAIAECSKSLDDKFTEHLALNSNRLENIAAASLIPALLGWLFAWLAVVVYRWVRVGFQGAK
jgi:hypothetical protein